MSAALGERSCCKHVYSVGLRQFASERGVHCKLILPSCIVCVLWLCRLRSERARHPLFTCLLTPGVNSVWQLLSKHSSTYFDTHTSTKMKVCKLILYVEVHQVRNRHHGAIHFSPFCSLYMPPPLSLCGGKSFQT